MHILILKCEGHKFPRNPNAHDLELFCGTHFYGPLVVCLNRSNAPYNLVTISEDHLDSIKEINEMEKRNYPPPFVSTTKK